VGDVRWAACGGGGGQVAEGITRVGPRLAQLHIRRLLKRGGDSCKSNKTLLAEPVPVTKNGGVVCGIAGSGASGALYRFMVNGSSWCALASRLPSSAPSLFSASDRRHGIALWRWRGGAGVGSIFLPIL